MAFLGADTALLLFCIFSVFPFSLFHRYLCRDAFQRNLFGLVCGVCLGFLAFGWEALHLVLSAVGGYALLHVCPRTVVHIAMFVFTFSHLAFCQIYRMITMYLDQSWDLTGPLMFLILRLISLAFNYHDGLVYEKEVVSLDESSRGSFRHLMGEKKVIQRRVEYAVLEVPSFLDFFGYCFFFGYFLTGPVCDFRDYHDFVHRRKHVSPPWDVFFALFVRGVVYMGAAMFLTKFTIAQYMESEDSISSFESLPLLLRLWYMYIGALAFRSRYFMTWTIAQAGCLLAGFGYNGTLRVDEKRTTVQWDLLKNVDAPGYEVNPSMTNAFAENWNICTARFMKHYSHERLFHLHIGSSTIDREGARLLTMILSAIWHGFYPGYFIMFGSLFFADMAHRGFVIAIKPLLKDTAAVTRHTFDGICAVLSGFLLSYIGSSFILLDAAKSWNFFYSLRFTGHLIIATLFVIQYLVRKYAPPKKNRSCTTSEEKPTISETNTDKHEKNSNPSIRQRSHVKLANVSS